MFVFIFIEIYLQKYEKYVTIVYKLENIIFLDRIV